MTDFAASDLKTIYPKPTPRVIAKARPEIDAHAKKFIAMSPFCVLATSGTDGSVDASPRGGAPGFVAVLDEKTLLLPDRVGNKRADTTINATAHNRLGLLFMVPGIDETVRVNGSVRVTIDPELLLPLSVAGKAPVSGLLVTAEEVFFHCGKALLRADLWNPDRRVPRASFPSLGKILADQIAGGKAEEYERGVEEQYRTRLY